MIIAIPMSFRDPSNLAWMYPFNKAIRILKSNDYETDNNKWNIWIAANSDLFRLSQISGC
ncbi:hypothetical protein GCM10027566_02050 [Arachidicoccus ginsenosidivorans]